MTDTPPPAKAPAPNTAAPAASPAPARAPANAPATGSFTKKGVAVGAAAVGIGSAAIVAALLYTRRR